MGSGNRRGIDSGRNAFIGSKGKSVECVDIFFASDHGALGRSVWHTANIGVVDPSWRLPGVRTRSFQGRRAPEIRKGFAWRRHCRRHSLHREFRSGIGVLA